MGWWRSRWVRGLVLWTLVALVVAVGVGIGALVGLDAAQQSCFFGYPSVPCPASDDPRVAQLTFAFFGVPLIWLVGTGAAVVAWLLGRRRGARPRS